MSKPRKTNSKKPRRRTDLPRPYCNGDWTEARMRSFVMSALRRASWSPKFDVINRAFVRKGINPETGKPCKLHLCEECGNEFPKGKMKADHHEPVIPIRHSWADDPGSFLGYNWNEVMRRLWIEQGDGWNVICEQCHLAKTDAERAERAAVSQQPPASPSLFPQPSQPNQA